MKLRQSKYLNNIVEQDHRGIKRLVKPGMGFGSFNTARITIRGYEMREHGEKRTSYWHFQRRYQRATCLHPSNLWGGYIIHTPPTGLFYSHQVFATQPEWAYC